MDTFSVTCQDISTLLYCTITLFIGLIALYYLFKSTANKIESAQERYLSAFYGWLHPTSPGYLNTTTQNTFKELFSENLRRRNELLSTYSQTIIAILIVTAISILLLTHSISAEAGLPILSGVSGFAIAKGISESKGVTATPDTEDRNRG